MINDKKQFLDEQLPLCGDEKFSPSLNYNKHFDNVEKMYKLRYLIFSFQWTWWDTQAFLGDGKLSRWAEAFDNFKWFSMRRGYFKRKTFIFSSLAGTKCLSCDYVFLFIVCKHIKLVTIIRALFY